MVDMGPLGSLVALVNNQTFYMSLHGQMETCGCGEEKKDSSSSAAMNEQHSELREIIKSISIFQNMSPPRTNGGYGLVKTTNHILRRMFRAI